MKRAKILITGGGGWIASNLIDFLDEDKFEIFITSTKKISLKRKCKIFVAKKNYEGFDWNKALDSIDIVVHLAGIAHNNGKNASDYNDINHKLTLKIAEEARENNISKFLYISSSKAKIIQNEAASKKNFYALSKIQAEAALDKFDKGSMQLYVIRPPLVYGKGAKANFKSILLAAKFFIPLPLRAFDNKINMISIDNLIDLIIYILNFEKKINFKIEASDPFQLSLTELYDEVLKSYNRPSFLNFYIPIKVLKLVMNFFFMKEIFLKLSQNHNNNSFFLKENLGWTAPYNKEDCFNFLRDNL